MPSKVLLAMLALTLLAAEGDSARILGLLPSHSRSHMISFEALTKELAARGHQLTVISSYPLSKPVANYTDIAVPLNRFGLDELNLFEISKVDILKVAVSAGTILCDHFLGNPQVQKLIHSKDEHFDLILIGVMLNECLLGFAHKYQAPVIAVVSMGGGPYILDIVGNPSPYSYVPNLLTGFTDHMTFKQRVINTLYNVASKMMGDFLMMPPQDAKMREYFSEYEPIPYITELSSSLTSMIFLNNHFSIAFPKPLLPSVLEVGGMHIKEPKKLPQDLQSFLDGAKDGAIYFSLGSNLKASEMSVEKREAFAKTFAGMKQRVLWKADLDHIDGLPPNVKLGKWMPQNDILAHPSVVLFISHGGLLSTQEAIYHGVPVLGIPVFGDQQMNMRQAELSGYAVTLEYANVTATSLNWALHTLLNEPSYRETIQQLSARFRDQPSTALEQAAFWTEYVLRHGGASHMRSAALDLAWYQCFLLDVMALAALLVALLALAGWVAVKTARRLCAGHRGASSAASDKKTK